MGAEGFLIIASESDWLRVRMKGGRITGTLQDLVKRGRMVSLINEMMADNDIEECF